MTTYLDRVKEDARKKAAAEWDSRYEACKRGEMGKAAQQALLAAEKRRGKKPPNPYRKAKS